MKLIISLSIPYFFKGIIGLFLFDLLLIWCFLIHHFLLSFLFVTACLYYSYFILIVIAIVFSIIVPVVSWVVLFLCKKSLLLLFIILVWLLLDLCKHIYIRLITKCFIRLLLRFLLIIQKPGICVLIVVNLLSNDFFCLFIVLILIVTILFDNI